MGRTATAPNRASSSRVAASPHAAPSPRTSNVADMLSATGGGTFVSQLVLNGSAFVVEGHFPAIRDGDVRAAATTRAEQ